MPKFIITLTERWQVEADSAEQALASYRVSVEGAPPELVNLDPDSVIPGEDFEYLDGTGEAEENA